MAQVDLNDFLAARKPARPAYAPARNTGVTAKAEDAGGGLTFVKFASDAFTEILAGGVDAYDAVGGVIGLVDPDLAKKMSDQAGSAQDYLRNNLSPEGAKALEKKFFDLSKEAAYRDPYSLFLNAIRQVPNLATIAIPGGAAAKGAQLLGTAAKGTKIAKISGQAAGGFVQSGGASGADAVREVQKAGGNNERVKELVEAGLPEEEAIAKVAEEARRTAVLASGAVGAATAPLELFQYGKAFGRGAGTVAKPVTKPGALARTGRIAKAGGESFATEFVQEGGEQAGTELAKSQAGLEFDTGNVLEAATAGGVTGTAVRGGARVAGTARSFLPNRKLSQIKRDAKLVEAQIEAAAAEEMAKRAQAGVNPELGTVDEQLGPTVTERLLGQDAQNVPEVGRLASATPAAAQARSVALKKRAAALQGKVNLVQIDKNEYDMRVAGQPNQVTTKTEGKGAGARTTYFRKVTQPGTGVASPNVEGTDYFKSRARFGPSVPEKPTSPNTRGPGAPAEQSAAAASALGRGTAQPIPTAQPTEEVPSNVVDIGRGPSAPGATKSSRTVADILRDKVPRTTAGSGALPAARGRARSTATPAGPAPAETAAVQSSEIADQSESEQPTGRPRVPVRTPQNNTGQRLAAFGRANNVASTQAQPQSAAAVQPQPAEASAPVPAAAEPGSAAAPTEPAGQQPTPSAPGAAVEGSPANTGVTQPTTQQSANKTLLQAVKEQLGVKVDATKPSVDMSPDGGGASTRDPITEKTTIIRNDGSSQTIDGPPPSDASDPAQNLNTTLGQVFEAIRRNPNPTTTVELIKVMLGLETRPAFRATLERLGRTVQTTRIVVQKLPSGRFAEYDPSKDTIRIDPELILPAKRNLVVMHEIAHAATIAALRNDPSGRLEAQVTNIRARLADVLEETGLNEVKEEVSELRAMDNEEFMAGIFGNPNLEAALNALHINKTDNGWRRILGIIFNAIGMRANDRQTFREFMDRADWFGATDADRKALLAGAVASGDAQSVGWNPLSVLATLAGPLGPRVGGVGVLSNPAIRYQASNTKTWSRKQWVDALSVEHLVDLYEARLNAATGGVGGAALRAYQDASASMAHGANALILESSKVIGDFEDYARDEPKLARDLADIMHDATIWDLHPDLPVADPKNAVGMRNPGAATRYAELTARYASLGTDGQNQYKAHGKLIQKMHQLHENQLISNILDSYYKRNDATGAARPTPVDIATARTDSEIALTALLGAANTKSYLATTTYPKDVQAAISKLMAPRGVPGPYFPLARSGNFFVVMGDKAYRPATYTAAAWAANTDETLNVKRGSIKVDPATGNVTAEVRNYWVEAVNSEAEANDRRTELATKPGLANGYVRQYDQYMGELRQGLASNEINKIIESATEGISPASKDAVANNLIELFAARSPEGAIIRSQIHRENVGGASRNISQAMMRQMTQIARQVARMRFDPVRSQAKTRMEEAEKAAARAGDNPTSFLLSDIRRSFNLRDDLAHKMAAGPGFFGSIAQRMGNITATMFLTNPATIITNGLQPWMVAVPYLAGKYGTVKSMQAMGAASKDAFSGALRIGKDAYRRRWTGKRAFHPGEMLHEQMTAGLGTGEKAMIDELVRNNRLDFTSSDDLLEITDPKKGVDNRGETFVEKGGNQWRKLQDYLFVAPKISETYNRVATAVATYRLAKDAGATDVEATAEADKAVRMTQFNYEQYNKPALFLQPALRNFLVFKQYAYNMYALQGFMLRQAFKGNTPQERAAAAMSIGAFYGLLFATAGAAGATPEPIWAALRLMGKIFGFEPETELRKGVAGLIGAEWSQVFAKGPLAATMNVDFSRLGISEAFIPRDLWDAGSPTEFFTALTMAYFGAPGGLATNFSEGMELMGQGQITKGIARGFPLRIVANPITAVQWMIEGYTDRKGNQVLSPEEIGPIGIGMKAIGFTPFDISERNALVQEKYKEETEAKTTKGSLYTKYYQALRDKDREGAAKIKQQMIQFNRDHPESKITAKNLKASVREQAKKGKQLKLRKVPTPNKASIRLTKELGPLYGVPQ